MRTWRMAAKFAPLACLLVALPVAAEGNGKARTYFGRGGSTGPYGPAPVKYQNPWTYQIFGRRVCVTPQDRYDQFARQYTIEQARHEVALNRLNWSAYDEYHNPRRPYMGSHPGGCNCNTGRCNECAGTGNCRGAACKFCNGSGKCGHKGDCSSCNRGPAGCSSCGGHKGHQHGCNACGGRGCASCGGRHGLGNGNHGGGLGPNGGPGGPVANRPYGYYPGMNHEDAVRYLEGFQYYPPNQMIRSPRDFFMWDTKYNIGH